MRRAGSPPRVVASTALRRPELLRRQVPRALPCQPASDCSRNGSSRSPGGRCPPLLREPDCGADTGIEYGIGLGAVRGRAGELERPGEEPQEGRRV